MVTFMVVPGPDGECVTISDPKTGKKEVVKVGSRHGVIGVVNVHSLAPMSSHMFSAVEA